MPSVSLHLLYLLAFAASGTARAADCPNCELAFPKAWTRTEQPWGVEVLAEGDRIAVKVQTDAVESPLGPGDVADELVWLKDEAAQAGLTVSSENGRIVRTVSREPAVLLDYLWTDATGVQGHGFRLVRRCGVRLIFEQQAPELELDAITRVSERVRYTLPACVHLNADVIPLEVLEGVDHVRVQAPDEAPPATAAAPTPPVEEPAPPPEDRDAERARHQTLVFVAVALFGLLVLLGLMLRSGGRSGVAVPAPQRPPSQGSAPNGTGAAAPAFAAAPRSVTPAEPDERAGREPDEPIEEIGEENTDAVLPAGTYGLRGAGGGERTERVPLPPEDVMDTREPPWPGAVAGERTIGPVSVPSHGVISYSNPVHRIAETVDDQGAVPAAGEAPTDPDEDDAVRISPVESALATLGVTTWLDFTAPGVSGAAFLPSTVADLIEVQNGGRFGYGWLLLLGLRRKNMDIMTLNGDARVKSAFGEGFLVGVFAFGNVLWAGPDQAWEIRTLGGERIPLGAGPRDALRALAQSAELRTQGAPVELVERCRSAVGELLPGWVYVQVPEPSVLPDGPSERPGWEPVQIIPFLELLSRR